MIYYFHVFMWIFLSQSLSAGPLDFDYEGHGCDGDTTEKVSMISLIANGNDYHEQLIATQGVLSLEDEATALFFSQDALRILDSESSIYLPISDQMQRDLKRYHGYWVFLVGYFVSGGEFRSPQFYSICTVVIGREP